jgi:ribosome biogenesis GTPase
LEGIVIKSTGSWYEVETPEKERIQARLKGKFRIKGIKSTNPVAVGDRVNFHREGEEAVIDKIFDRKNYIIRRSINLSKQVQIIAANVDQLFLIVTLKNPQTYLGFVDRFLVGAEAYRIPVILVYNKIDLLETEDEKAEMKRWKTIYEKAGYEQLELSAEKGFGLDALKDKMKGKLSIFGGHSGVGKSTIVNCLDPNFNLRTGKVSESHQSGKHTTTFAEMFELDFGARIIDTPGIKGFGNVELEKEHLAHYFPEMRSRMNECKFNNCIHLNEPDCAIKKAVASGKIAESRYFNYLSIYEEDESESYSQKGF